MYALLNKYYYEMMMIKRWIIGIETKLSTLFGIKTENMLTDDTIWKYAYKCLYS